MNYYKYYFRREKRQTITTLDDPSQRCARLERLSDTKQVENLPDWWIGRVKSLAGYTHSVFFFF